RSRRARKSRSAQPRNSRTPSDAGTVFKTASFRLATRPQMALFCYTGPPCLTCQTDSMALDFKHKVTERFLRYVGIDTQSDLSSPTCPSTEKQKNLGRLLAAELKAMGLADAHLDEYGYVYATIPASTSKTVPVICFCSHMDTSPDCTGANV